MKNNSNISEEIFEEVEFESSRLNKENLNEVILREKKIEKKAAKLDLKKFYKFIMQLKLSMSLIKDFRNKTYTNIPWRSIALLTTAMLYFINPFDVVPDFLPVLGYTDDGLLFAAVFKSIQSDLEKYSEWKGINTNDYF